MTAQPSSGGRVLPLRFKTRTTAQTWWAPVWRGLVVDETAKHYRAMRSAVWLYLYLVIHADRASSILYRRIGTIANDMALNPSTVRRWMSLLRKQNYIQTRQTGRALAISIERWKRLRTTGQRSLKNL
jgi:hypothetical protein